jgi:hypothetical protein
MKCTICKEKVVLVPSAEYRAKKYGGKPSDYTKLFPRHIKCELEENKKRVSKLIEDSVREKEDRDKRLGFLTDVLNVY